MQPLASYRISETSSLPLSLRPQVSFELEMHLPLARSLFPSSVPFSLSPYCSPSSSEPKRCISFPFN